MLVFRENITSKYNTSTTVVVPAVGLQTQQSIDDMSMNDRGERPVEMWVPKQRAAVA